ncbi:MAG: hypothetical protein ABSG81_06105 [Acidimicrobiales bacterium]
MGLLDTTFRHPALVGAATALVALVVVALRVEVAGQGHVGNLVLLGSRFVVPGSHVGVPVVHGNGYDGQFYYRLALDPLDFSPHAQGIVMDSPQRYERVVYPVLAWTLSAGHASLVPWSLIAVNVVCLGALGWLGALVARDGGRHPAWGLLVPAYFGFVWSLSRDLTEIVECTFIVAGLVALRRRRPVLCGLALSAAVLSRETALVVVACIGLVQLARWLAPGPGAVRRPESAPASHLTAWVLPVAVFAGWQGVVRSKIGHLPLLASGQHNLDVPFAGLARGFSHYAALLPGKSAVLWFGELAVLVFVVVTAARHLKTSAAPLHERLAWGAYGVLSLCLAPGIWLGDVGFRSLDDVYVLSVLVVLASPRRTRVIAPVMGLTWLVVAAELVKVI